MKAYSKFSAKIKSGILSIYRVRIKELKSPSSATFSHSKRVLRFNLFAAYIAAVSVFVASVTILSIQNLG